MKLTPEDIISLLTQYSENPLYEIADRDTLKLAAEMIAEQSEIKPHLEAEIARLQKERDVAVASKRASITREYDLIAVRQKDWKNFNIEKSKLLLRIAELEKYKARLDALIRYSDDGETFLSVSKNALNIYCEYGSIEAVGTGNSEYEAIDAAMEAEK